MVNFHCERVSLLQPAGWPSWLKRVADKPINQFGDDDSRVRSKKKKVGQTTTLHPGQNLLLVHAHLVKRASQIKQVGVVRTLYYDAVQNPR